MNGAMKRITGCYIKKEYIKIWEQREHTKFVFSAYARRLLEEGFEKKIYGVYMLEPNYSRDFGENDSSYIRCTTNVSEDLLRELSVLFKDKWKDTFKTFPIRPYLYWLIRRDITGESDSVIRLPKESTVPDYIRRNTQRYIGQQHSVSPMIRRKDLEAVLEKYGNGCSFSSYVKRLFAEGLTREDFGVAMTPAKDEDRVKKTIYISTELANSLSSTFESYWASKYKEFPYCGYLYYLMEKDLYMDR